MKTTAEAKHDLLLEIDDLSGKIERLEKFIKHEADHDKALLMGQLKAMMDYKMYLLRRLDKLQEKGN